MKFIKKFPKRRNFIERLYDNLVFNVFGGDLIKRKNWLTKKDIKDSKKKLKKGDILVVGDLRSAYSKIVNEPVTHSAIYIGKNTSIRG